MGEVIQLQGDQRKDVQEFLVDKKEGLELDAKTIKVTHYNGISLSVGLTLSIGPWFLDAVSRAGPASSCSGPIEALSKNTNALLLASSAVMAQAERRHGPGVGWIPFKRACTDTGDNGRWRALRGTLCVTRNVLDGWAQNSLYRVYLSITILQFK